MKCENAPKRHVLFGGDGDREEQQEDAGVVVVKSVDAVVVGARLDSRQEAAEKVHDVNSVTSTVRRVCRRKGGILLIGDDLQRV